MKATSTHIALATVAMYGVLSATYLYGQANKLPARDPAKQTEKTPATDPSYPLQASDGVPGPLSYKTIHVERADAGVLAKQIQDLVPDARIVGDARTNQIIIHGGKEDIATAENLIKQLDVPTPQKPQAVNGGPPGVPGMPAPAYVWVTPGAKPAYPAVPQSNGSADVANELVKQLQPLLAQSDQLKSIGKTEEAQKLQARIAQLLSEETRRAEENIQRTKEIVQRATEQAQKALASGDDQLRQTAEQDRKAAEEGERGAEQARRTIDQFRRSIENRERAQEVARRAIEVEQRIAALSIGIQKLEAGGELSDKQKADLDEAKQQLKVQLVAQFDQRQQVESLELKQLRDRLDKLEKELSDRSQNRDNQINQRFQELTAPPSQQGADKRTTTIKASNLTLENVNGAKQLTITSPSEITIRTDITQPAASVDPKAAPELAPEGSSIPAPADASEAK
jgi:hypothetical protein